MTDDISAFEERFTEYVAECQELRFSVSAGDYGDHITTIHKNLVEVRQALDRVEEVYANVIRAKGRIDQAVANRLAARDDKWDDAARDPHKAFKLADPAPRERYAHYNLMAMTATKSLREAEKLQRLAKTTLEVVKLFHDGLNNIRWTLDARLRSTNIETRLER